MTLIDLGCNVYKMCIDDTLLKYNGLDYVCQLGYNELLVKMLQYKHIRRLINRRKKHVTPLTLACQENHNDIFDILISNGADPELPVKDKTTPLMFACMNNHISIIDKLLALNVNPNAVDRHQNTAIFHCTNIDILHKLYINGADLNSQNIWGQTPLIYALIDGYQQSIIKALINLRPNLNHRDRQGRTALIFAVQLRITPIVEFLLDNGAEVQILDKYNLTAINYLPGTYYNDVQSNKQLIELFRHYVK